MRKIILFFSFITVHFFTYGAKEYHESKRLSGSELQVGTLLTVTDANYGQTLVPYHESKITGSLHLGLDFHKITGLSDGDKIDLELGVKVWFYTRTGSLIGSDFVTKTLKLSYVNDFGQQSKGIDALDMDGAYYVKAEITSVSATRTALGGSPQSISVPDYCIVKAYVQSERYYPMDVTAVPFTGTAASLTHFFDPGSNQLEVRWDYWSGAEEYELEYIYVDDYTDQTGLSLGYDFKKNSTRIVIQDNHYRIPLLYDKGYLIYRVRPVGRTGTGFKQPLFGKWSGGVPDQGAISAFPAANKLYINQIIDLVKKNWQYSASFAEQGKRKDVIGYFDGSLRSRQQQVFSNTEQEVIVGETVYDHIGRGVISTLPVPLPPDRNDKKMFFQENFNTQNGVQYNKNHFDTDTSGPGCGPNPLPMDSSSGTSQYYSSNNPLQQSENAYIPRANGYGFSQVEYLPDNTGRIRRQSGVGKDHKLGSGHETRYMYESPSQEELDAMFGNDAGFASHYTKTLVIDPNGQVSVSYTDMTGKVIATYLTGDKPQNLDSILSYTGLQDKSTVLLQSQYPYYLDASGNLQRHSYNRNSLSSSNEFSSLNKMGLELQHTIAVVSDEVEYTFNYDVTPEKLNELKCVDGNGIPVCYDCIYDMRITVLNECGEEVYKSDKETIGNLGSTSADYNSDGNQSTYTHAPFTLTLNKGMYTVLKNLTVNEAAMNLYAEEYWLQYKQSCTSEFTTPGQLLDSLSNNFICEDEGCSNCLELLAADFADHLQKFGASSMSKRNYYVSEKECRDQCNSNDANDILYRTLKADVSLHGQYGCIDYKDGCERTSVFNTSNSLSTNYYFSAGNWRKPYYNEFERNTELNIPDVNAGLSHYFNEYGDVDYVPLTVTLPEEDLSTVTYNNFLFAPEVMHTMPGDVKLIQNGAIKLAYYTDEIRDPITHELQQDAGLLKLVPGIVVNTPYDLLRTLEENQVWVIEPHHLHRVEDFISKWNDNWASSLVVNHPEFCYYKYRVANTQVPVEVSGAGGLSYTSEEFDQMLRSTYAEAAIDPAGIQIGDYKDDAAVNVQLVNLADARNENNTGDFLLNKDPFFAKNTSLKAMMLEKLKTGRTGKDIRVEISLANRMPLTHHVPAAELDASFGTRFMEDDPATVEDEMELDWTAYASRYMDFKDQIIKEYSDKYCSYTYLIDPTMGFTSSNSCIGNQNFHPSVSAWRYYFHNGGNQWYWNAILSPCGWWHHYMYKNKTKRYNSVYDIDPYGSASGGDICTIDNQDPEYLHQQANLIHYQQTGQYPVLRDLQGLLDGLIKKNSLSYTGSSTLPDFLFSGRNSGLVGQDLNDVLVYGKPMPVHMSDNGWRNKRLKWEAALSKGSLDGNTSSNYYNLVTGNFRMYVEGNPLVDRAPNYTCGEVKLFIPPGTYSYRTYGAETSLPDGSMTLASELFNIPLSLEGLVTVTSVSALNGVEQGPGADRTFEVKVNTLYGLRYIGLGSNPNTYRFIGKVEFEITEVQGGVRKSIGYKTVSVQGETCIAIDGSLDSDMSEVCKPSREAKALLQLMNTMAFSQQFSCGCPQDLGHVAGQPRSEVSLKDFYDPVLNKYLYCTATNEVPAHIPFIVDCGGSTPVPDDEDFDSGDFELHEEIPGAPQPTSFSSPALPESFSGFPDGEESTVAHTTTPQCPPSGTTYAMSVGSTITTQFVHSNPNEAMSFSIQVVDDGTLPPGFTFNTNDILGFSCMKPGHDINTFTATVWVKVNGEVVPVSIIGALNFGTGREAGCSEFPFLECGPLKPYTCDNDFNRNREQLELFLDELAGSDVPASSGAYNYNILRNNPDSSPVNVNLTENLTFSGYLQKRLGNFNDSPLSSMFTGAQNANPNEEVHYANTLQILSVKDEAGVSSNTGSRMEASFSYLPVNGTTVPLCGLALEFINTPVIPRPSGVNFSHLVGFRNLKVAPAIGVAQGQTLFSITAVYFKDGVYGTAQMEGVSCLAMENCDEGCVEGGFDELNKAGRFNDPSLSSDQNLKYYESDYSIRYGEPLYSGQMPGSFVTREVKPEDANFSSTCSSESEIGRKGLKDHTGNNSHMLVISTGSNPAPMKAWYKRVQVRKGQEYVLEASVAGVSEYRCAASGQIEHPYELAVYNSAADNNEGYISFRLSQVNPTIEEAYMEVTYTDDVLVRRIKTRNGRKGEVLADIPKLNLASVKVMIRTREYGLLEIENILNTTTYQTWISHVLPNNQNNNNSSGNYQPYQQSGTYIPASGSSCIGCITPAAAGNTEVSLYYRYTDPLDPMHSIAAIQSNSSLRYDQGWQKLGGTFIAEWADDERSRELEIGVLFTDNGSGQRLIALDDIYMLTECGYSSDNMIVDINSPCEDMKQSVVDISVYIEDRQKKDQVLNDFRAAYRKKCLTAAENFVFHYKSIDHHYTLYYYDQAGNLVMTVPPEGVKLQKGNAALTKIKADRLLKDAQGKPRYDLAIQPNHTLETDYRYNSLNQLVTQRMPDHETFELWDVADKGSIPSGFVYQDASFADMNQGFVIANDAATGISTIFKTDDAAQTWTSMSTLGGIGNITAVQYLTETMVYAVTDSKRLLTSSDGGVTWVVHLLQLPAASFDQLTALHFVSPSEGILIDKRGNVYGTSSADFSVWTVLAASPSVDANFSEVVHDGASAFYATTTYDGSNSTAAWYKLAYSGTQWQWTTIESKPHQNILDITHDNSGNAVGVGENGLMTLFRTNGPSGYESGIVSFIPNSLDLKEVVSTSVFGNMSVLDVDGAFNYASLVNFSLQWVNSWTKGESSAGIASGIAPAEYVEARGIKRTFLNNQWNQALNLNPPAGENILSYDRKGDMYVLAGSGTRTLRSEIHSAFTLTLPVNTDKALTQLINNSSNPEVFDYRAYGAVISNDKKIYNLVNDVVDASPLLPLDPAVTYLALDIKYDDANRPITQAGSSPMAQTMFAVGSDGKIYQIEYGTASPSVNEIGNIPAQILSASQVTAFDRHSNNRYILAAGADVYASTNASVWTPLFYNTPGLSRISPLTTGGKLYATSSSDGLLYTLNTAGPAVTMDPLTTPSTTGNDNHLDENLNGIVLGTNGRIVEVNAGIAAIVNTSFTTEYFASVEKSGNTYLITGSQGLYEYDPIADQLTQLVSSGSLNVTATNTASSHSVAAGDGGTIYHKTGSGSWSNATQLLARELSAIAAEGQYITAVGKSGAILYSGDNGNHWEYRNTTANTDFTSVVSIGIGDKFLFTGTNGRVYLLTTSSFSAPFPMQLPALTYEMYNPGEGSLDHLKKFNGTVAAISSNGHLIWSTNNGSSWNKKLFHSGLNNIAFADANTVYGVGDNGLIVRTTLDAGSAVTELTQTNTQPWTSADLHEVSFSDYDHGYVLGENGTILKTINRGETWLNKSNPSYTGTYLTVQAMGTNGLYLAGQNGTSPNVKGLTDYSDKISTRFWYDDVARIVASQNTRQARYSVPGYSYTVYDALGRITEAGEVLTSATLAMGVPVQPSQLDAWLNTPGNTRRDINRSYYTQPKFSLPVADFTQDAGEGNYLNRIVSSTYQRFETYGYSGAQSGAYSNAQHYSYDIHGNVKIQVSEDSLMGAVTGHRFKRMDYDYDLISGKVNQVTYQATKRDQFMHRYSYDADNRITQVTTSRDGLRWEADASYDYYRHGPLARMEAGQYNLQGMDYAYTIQGWIKGVNSASLSKQADMGKDATALNINQLFAPDEMGYTLGYFKGDYSNIVNHNQAAQFAPNVDQATDFNRNELFNGNISAMSTAIAGLKESGAPHTYLSRYGYDQLNRLTSVDKFYKSSIGSDDNSWTNAARVNDYSERFTYDANGNILTAIRNGRGTLANASGTGLDSLRYRYHTIANGFLENTNRLLSVNDAAAPNTETNDIEHQEPFDNYAYDGIGNLILDNQEEIKQIDWLVTGKILSVTRIPGSSKLNLSFGYNAAGHRVWKRVYDPSNQQYRYTFYVHDASGNTMAVYEKNELSEMLPDEPQGAVLSEQSIYGSSRVAIFHPNQSLTAAQGNMEVTGPGVDEGGGDGGGGTPPPGLTYDPGNASHILLSGNVNHTLQYGQTGFIAAGSTVTGSILLNYGSQLYIYGTTNLISLDNSGGIVKVYGVLNSASLTLGSGSVYENYGNISLTGNFTSGGSTFLNASTMSVGGNILINNGSLFTNRGTLTGSGMLSLEGAGKLFNENSLVIANSISLDNGSELQMALNSQTTGASLSIIGSSIVNASATAYLQVNGNVTLNGSGQMTGPVQLCLTNGGTINGTVGSGVNTNACGNQPDPNPNTPTLGEVAYAQYYGQKVYEMSNHLGNVLTTVSDNKLYIGGSFKGDVVSATDYYAFGAALKTVSVKGYRYGFNGMEKDEELKGSGNSYTTEFRQYDPRIGRWLSLDPLMAKYPDQSPYAAFNNNPLHYSDHTGLEGVPEKKQQIRAARDRIKDHRKAGRKSMIKEERKLIKEIKENGAIYGTRGGDFSTFNQKENNKDFNTNPTSQTTGKELNLSSTGGGGTGPITTVNAQTLISARNASGAINWIDIGNFNPVEGYNQGPFPVSTGGTNTLNVTFWPTTFNARANIWDVTDPNNPRVLGATMTSAGDGLAVSQLINIPNGVTNVSVQVWGGPGAGSSSYFALELILTNTQTTQTQGTVKEIQIKE